MVVQTTPSSSYPKVKEEIPNFRIKLNFCFSEIYPSSTSYPTSCEEMARAKDGDPMVFNGNVSKLLILMALTCFVFSLDCHHSAHLFVTSEGKISRNLEVAIAEHGSGNNQDKVMILSSVELWETFSSAMGATASCSSEGFKVFKMLESKDIKVVGPVKFDSILFVRVQNIRDVPLEEWFYLVEEEVFSELRLQKYLFGFPKKISSIDLLEEDTSDISSITAYGQKFLTICAEITELTDRMNLSTTNTQELDTLAAKVEVLFSKARDQLVQVEVKSQCLEELGIKEKVDLRLLSYKVDLDRVQQKHTSCRAVATASHLPDSREMFAWPDIPASSTRRFHQPTSLQPTVLTQYGELFPSSQ